MPAPCQQKIDLKYDGSMQSRVISAGRSAGTENRGELDCYNILMDRRVDPLLHPRFILELLVSLAKVGEAHLVWHIHCR